jgi:hypothetical protein
MSRYIPKDGLPDPTESLKSQWPLRPETPSPSVNLGAGTIIPELNPRAALGFSKVRLLFRQMFQR